MAIAELSSADLIKICHDLGQSDIKSIKFLCRNVIPVRRLEFLDTFPKLVTTFLECSNTPKSENGLIASQLLYLISRFDLLNSIDAKQCLVETTLERSRYFNTFRIKVLFKLSLEIVKKDLEDLKFYFKDKISKTKSNSIEDAEDLFIALEQMYPNVNDLKSLLIETFESLQQHRLLEIVKEFEKAETKTTPPSKLSTAQQETCKEASSKVYIPGYTNNYYYTHQDNNLAEFKPPTNNNNNNNNNSLPTSPQTPGPYSRSKIPAPSREEDNNSSFTRSTRENSYSSIENSMVSSSSSPSSISDNNAFPGLCPQQTNSRGLVYPMKNEIPGVCLIINNEKFDSSGFNPRKGSEIDERRIENFFGMLKFRIIKYKNLKSDEMVTKFDEVSVKEVKDCDDCFVCFILSHGDIGNVIFGSDSKEVPLYSLTKPFHAAKCLQLENKPKLFFIQACQGTRCNNSDELEADNAKSFRVIEESHFLVTYASLPSFAALRSPSNGTWFINSLINVFELSYKELSLLMMLGKVIEDVSSRKSKLNGKDVSQTPVMLSNLIGDIYFNKNH